MRGSTILVLVLEALIVCALWMFQRVFS